MKKLVVLLVLMNLSLVSNSQNTVGLKESVKLSLSLLNPKKDSLNFDKLLNNIMLPINLSTNELVYHDNVYNLDSMKKYLLSDLNDIETRYNSFKVYIDTLYWGANKQYNLNILGLLDTVVSLEISCVWENGLISSLYYGKVGIDSVHKLDRSKCLAVTKNLTFDEALWINNHCKKDLLVEKNIFRENVYFWLSELRENYTEDYYDSIKVTKLSLSDYLICNNDKPFDLEKWLSTEEVSDINLFFRSVQNKNEYENLFTFSKEKKIDCFENEVYMIDFYKKGDIYRSISFWWLNDVIIKIFDFNDDDVTE